MAGSKIIDLFDGCLDDARPFCLSNYCSDVRPGPHLYTSAPPGRLSLTFRAATVNRAVCLSSGKLVSVSPALTKALARCLCGR